MRHKYETRGIVLSRTTLGETTALLTLLTKDLGLVRARAQSVRRSGARLAPFLATLVESDVILVRGEEGWRVAGATFSENWFQCIKQPAGRERASRVTGLLLRLVAGEERDASLYPIASNFFRALSLAPKESHESAEILAALYILQTLGLDSGSAPAIADYGIEAIGEATTNRKSYIGRINRGIAASGL